MSLVSPRDGTNKNPPRRYAAPLLGGDYAQHDTKAMLCSSRGMLTLQELEEQFGTEEQCLAYLVGLRWPTGVRGTRCQSAKVYKVSRAWKWQCKQCYKQGYRFSPLVGTLFENTKYPLTIWFKVIYLLCQSKKGMSALQIHRMIGSGSYRTAWSMCHRIRGDDDGGRPPAGGAGGSR